MAAVGQNQIFCRVACQAVKPVLGYEIKKQVFSYWKDQTNDGACGQLAGSVDQ